MIEGRFVFAQVLDFVSKYEFRKCVKRYNGDHRAHELTCLNQFRHLLFGQLTSCSSIRDICMCLKAHRNRLFHMGFGNTVDHTTLTRANERRDYRIYEDFGQYLIQKSSFFIETSICRILMQTMLFLLLTQQAYRLVLSCVHGH